MSNNKWIKLDGKKDPPFDKVLFLHQDEGNLFTGVVDEIKLTADGKTYSFMSEDTRVNDITHYMIPDKPKD